MQESRLLHLSHSILDGETVSPQIPDNFMTKLGYEDSSIPRISFAPTISNCILGIGYNKIKDRDRKYFVYEPYDYDGIKIITNKEIIDRELTPDAKITKESWITSECRMKRVGTIKITNPCKESEPVIFKDKEITRQYYWDYEVIEGKDELE